MLDAIKLNVSIIVPALNEEKHIGNAVKSIIKELDGRSDYEIIIFDDGSTDNTGSIADDLVLSYSQVRVVHHQTPQNLGSCFMEGVELAQGEYAVMWPGDDEIEAHTIKNIFDTLGSADIVTTHTINKVVRKPHRRFISATYTFLINLLFNLRLEYFNGLSLIKVDLIKKLPRISPGFAYMSEILVRLIKSGYSYKEIGMQIKPLKGRESKAFKLRNIRQVVSAISNLFVDVYWKKKILY